MSISVLVCYLVLKSGLTCRALAAADVVTLLTIVYFIIHI